MASSEACQRAQPMMLSSTNLVLLAARLQPQNYVSPRRLPVHGRLKSGSLTVLLASSVPPYCFTPETSIPDSKGTI